MLRTSIAVILGVSCVLSLPARAEDPPTKEQLENSIGLFAKLLCSGVFVIGREPEEFIANDLQAAGPGAADWSAITYDVDRTKKRVTLSLEGIPSRTAVYLGDQGCSLLQRDMAQVHFTPVELQSTLPPADSTAWPMGDVISSDAPKGVDGAALESALDFAFDDTRHDPDQNTRAMVVVHRGQIVSECYREGWSRDTRHICWSMGKSITATLIGLLVKDGSLAIDDPAPIAAWRGADDPRRQIRIADLLHMSGGLKFGRGGTATTRFTSADHHTLVYFGAPNVFDYSINPPLEHLPNTVWRYLNCDPLSLGKIVRDTVEARGEEYLSYPQRGLFDKIGMRNMVLECDPWGNFIMTGFDYGTARDWARFGMLYLNDGVWQGERILPEGWVDFVKTPAPASKAKDYGALFWLNAGGSFQSLPRDMYWPAGHHGQSCFIIPSRELIVVRLGHSALGGYDEYIEAVLGNVLSAFAKP